MNAFAQERGHKVCQNIGVGKCDNPKCSLNCHAWWAHKTFRCLERFCSTLSASYIKLCGSLKMWDGATIADHKKARERLQTDLRKWEKQTGGVFRVLLCSHPTAIDRLHYDVVAYTSVSLSMARKVLKAAWTGRPRSVHKVEEIVNLDGWLKYCLKDVKRQEHEYVYLLERGKLLKQLYGCPQFGFSKAVQKEIWEELCREAHGDKRRTYYEMLENAPLRFECRKALVEMVTFILENNPSVYELKSRFRDDVRYVHVDLLKECAGLRQKRGRYEFDAVLGVPLPPSNPTERTLWERGTGQSSKDLIETFAQAASKAVMRTANKRQTEPNYRGLGFYSQCEGLTMEHIREKRELIVDGNVPAINNKLSLSPSTYTEPADLPEILRRPVARE